MESITSSRLIVRIVIYLISSGLFSYQIWRIGEEYFRYPTITPVTLENIPKLTVAPKAGFRMFHEVQGGGCDQKYL
jgi:hypothetical protein